MSEQVKKDIVVVARKGYSVLLEIDDRMFDIDCHEAINLSNIFSADILEKSSSLSTHLKDGNLIFFEKDTELSKDVTASAEIKPLREETAQHITAQYEQAEKDSNRIGVELETRANITDATADHIQEQVQASREKILQTDKKFLTKTVKAIQTTNEVDSPSKERQNAMTVDELTMKVSMDVSPEEFAEKQTILKNNASAKDVADEIRANQEIAKQDAEQAEQDQQDQ